MATTCHTIYSHYDPKRRQPNETLDSQNSDEENSDDELVIQAAVDTRRRLTATAPRFVPASSTSLAHPQALLSPSSTLSSEIAPWYRSLTNNGESAYASRIFPDVSPSNISSSSESLRAGENSRAKTPTEHIKRKVEPRTKNNWFIMNALQSHSSTTPDVPQSTIADMLERDPPPQLPGEFRPPVFLVIGPSNRGYAMLQQSGWSEGEPLGPDVIRHAGISSSSNEEVTDAPGRELNVGSTVKKNIKREEIEVKCDEGDEISEVRRVNIIDLTLSDSEEDGEVSDSLPAESIQSARPFSALTTSTSSDRTALLTPIATRLKSDRLGLGLKAKTVGPHRASQKRITHGAAQLAAHIRAGEDLRKKKSQTGRGSRGFARASRHEEARRRAMMAYMNE